MGIFRKVGDWFYNGVMRHMANTPPRQATKEEAEHTKEMQEKYKKWAGFSGGTTDENKDKDSK